MGNGQILYNGNENIVIINEDGTGKRNLTNDRIDDINAAWSPDGTKIAFSREVSYGNWEICIINADGTGFVNITENAAWDRKPVWSPDGTKIAFLTYRGLSSHEIFIMDADGSNQVSLGYSASNFEWLSDSKIALIESPGSQYQLTIVNTDGSGHQSVNLGLEPGGASDDFNISPNGNKIAFSYYGDIYTMNMDTTGITMVSGELGGTSNSPSWSPDGKKILFVSRSGSGDKNVWVMNADGSGKKRLTSNPSDDISPTWSPDGSKIIWSYNDAIYIMNADGSGKKKLTDEATGGIWRPFNTKGTNGNDVLSGGIMADTLKGLAGNDNLAGHEGNDILDGGMGNDILQGGAGSDQYLFGVGYGHDRIVADASNFTDTVVFGKGITAAMLDYSRSGDDLVISLNENDSLTVAGWFSDANNRIGQFKFADGSIYKYMEDMNTTVSGIQGSSGNDLIVNWDGASIVEGLAGNDIIYGYEGNAVINGGTGADTIFGGAGNDTIVYDAADAVDGGEGRDLLDASTYTAAVTINLNTNSKLKNIEDITGGKGADRLTGDSGDNIIIGNAGNDILDGGMGNDILQGGAGSDQYLFGVGYGHDRIVADASNITDTVVFGKGITAAMLEYSRSDDDLVIILNENDSLTVAGWFSDANNRIGQFKFADGSIYKYMEDMNTAVSGIQGSSSNDLIVNWDGASIVEGLAGNDIIYGYEGNAVINGGTGADTIFGGAGSDTIVYDAADAVDGGEGHDLLDASTYTAAVTINLNTNSKLKNIEDITGGKGADRLTGDSGDNIIIGNAGNDILDGGMGNDILQGGAGSDQYLFGVGYGHDRIVADASNITDTVVFGKGITAAMLEYSRSDDDLVIILNENDSLTVAGWFSDANNRIGQFKFADGSIYKYVTDSNLGGVIQGSNGNDFIINFNDVKIIYAGAGNDIVYGGNSDEIFYSQGGKDQIFAGAGDDIIIYDTQSVVDGGSGHDIIDASFQTAAVTFDLNQNSSRYKNIEGFKGGSGNDRLIGNVENNTLIGNGGNDIISGGAGNDKLDGGDGDDIIDGGSGDDIIIFSKGKDKIDGGADFDTLDASNFNDDLSLDIRNYTNIERLIGGRGDDTLVGSSGNDTLSGFQGNDILIGNGGKDVLTGGGGADVYLFKENFGNATITKDEYNHLDTLKFDYDPGTFTLKQEGNDLVVVFTSGDSITINGWYESSTFQVNKIKISSGGSETDYSLYVGGDSADILTGSTGADQIFGFDGDDVLDGDRGNDILTGGKGSDTYVFKQGFGNDVILAEETNDLDRLVFDVNVNIDPIISSDGNLLIRVTDNDTLTLQGWYSNEEAYRISEITLKDYQFSQETSYRLFDSLIGMDADEILAGSDLNEIVIGHAGNDWLVGAGGSDWLVGGDGNDSLDGGTGDDRLSGGSGSDTFVFGANFGHDALLDYDGLSGDVIKFQDGVSFKNVTAWYGDLSTLVLRFDNGGGVSEELSILNWDNNAYKPLSFEIGGKIMQINHVVIGSDGNDTLWGNQWDFNIPTHDFIDGGAGDDIIYAGAGNDILNGGMGNDYLSGGEGNDLLYGGSGNNTIYGGSGNDCLFSEEGENLLFGDEGDDVYMVSSTSHSTIYNYSSEGGNDIVKFNEDTVTKDTLAYHMEGSDLVLYNLAQSESAECVRFSGWANGSEYQIASLQFANGETLNAVQLYNLASNNYQYF